MFYLAGALLLPARTLFRQLRGTPVKWTPVLHQTGIALGILAGLWLTGALLGLVVGPWFHPVHERAAAAAPPHPNVVHLVSLLVSFGTLVAALMAVEVARLVVSHSEAKSRPWQR
jgi:hypothetical protein